jgi:hypothetical protein
LLSQPGVGFFFIRFDVICHHGEAIMTQLPANTAANTADTTSD